MVLRVLLLTAALIATASPAPTPVPMDPECDTKFGSYNGRLMDNAKNEPDEKEAESMVPTSNMPSVCDPGEDMDEGKELTRISDLYWKHKAVIAVVTVLLLGGAIYRLVTYKRDAFIECNH